MPSGQEIKSSIYGAWRVALLDPDALRYFNLTVDGFWRSFIAIPITFAIIMPKLLFGGDGPASEEVETLSREADAILTLLIGLVSWIVFPIAMIWISRLLNSGATYVQFIILWNWGSVVSSAIVLPASILYSHQFPTPGAAGMIMTLFTFALLYYSFRIARVGLACNALTAIAITIFEILMHLIIESGIRSLT